MLHPQSLQRTASTPHSFGFARLACELFTSAFEKCAFSDFLRIHQHWTGVWLLNSSPIAAIIVRSREFEVQESPAAARGWKVFRPYVQWLMKLQKGANANEHPGRSPDKDEWFNMARFFQQPVRALGKNSFIYAIGNIGLRAASFLLVPFYLHFLSISDYGLLATLLITIQLMSIVMDLGMRTGLLRFIREYEEKNQIKYLLGTTTFINIATGIISTCLLFLLLKPFFRSILHTDYVDTYILLTCAAALAQSLNIHILTYYRAHGKALRFMVVGISTAAALFVVNIIFLYVFNLGILGVLWAFIATYTAVSLLVFFDVLSKTGFGISLLLIPKLIRFGFPLIFSMAGQFTMNAAGIYFLSYFAGFEIVAIYALGHKLASVLGMTTSYPFQLAFQPYVFANLSSPDIKKNISRILTYFVFSIMFMSFCVLLGSRILLPLIAPPEYSSAYIVTLLLLPGVALTGISFFGETLLAAVKKTGIMGLAIFVVASISILLNYILIPKMHWFGAAITFNVSYILSGLTLSFIGLKNFPVPIEWQRISLITILFFSHLIILFLLQNTGNLIYYSTIIMAIIISALIFYCSPFFNMQERLILKNSLIKLKAIIYI